MSRRGCRQGPSPCTNRSADHKVLTHSPHSSPPLRGKELERRRWRKQRQFLGERQEQCERVSEAVRHWSDKGKRGVVVRPSVLQHGGDKNASQTPYKHRLAHASGRRSRSERAFRCVGVLGLAPSRFWVLLAGQKYHPAGRRRYRLCPN